jgi:hypothetical protein
MEEYGVSDKKLTTDLSQVTDKYNYKILYQLYLAKSENQIHNFRSDEHWVAFNIVAASLAAR